MCADRYRPFYPPRPSSGPPSGSHPGATGTPASASIYTAGLPGRQYLMYVWIWVRTRKGRQFEKQIRTFVSSKDASRDKPETHFLSISTCLHLGGTLAAFAERKDEHEKQKIYRVYSIVEPSSIVSSRLITVPFDGPVPQAITEAPGCCQNIDNVTVAQLMQHLEMPGSTSGRPIASTSSIAYPSSSAVTARNLRNYRQSTSRHSSPAYALPSAPVSMAATAAYPARQTSTAGPVSTNRQSATTTASAKPRLNLTRVTVYITYDERAGEYVHRYVGPTGPAQRLSNAQLNHPDNAEELSVAYKATAEGVSKGCVCYLVL